MDCGSEQEFLSGIEPFSTSDMSTPHRAQIQGNCLLQDISTSSLPDMEFSSMPRQLELKPVSPMKLTSASESSLGIGDTLSNAAQAITQNIEKSLASSLKLEEEAKHYLSRNHGQSNISFEQHSTESTPSSQMLAKTMSPSKPKVRFENHIRSKVGASPTCETIQNCNLKTETPTKTSRQDFIYNSPVSNTLLVKDSRDNLDQDMKVQTPFKSSIEASLLSSLKIPQNAEERAKLSEFLHNMETSASGDPLASLFDLEYDLKLSDLSSKPAVIKSVKESQSTVPKTAENDSEFQIKRRKGVTKRNLDKKDFSKKTSRPRKDNPGKNGSVKSSVTVKRNTTESKIAKNPPKTFTTKPEAKPSTFTAEGRKNIGNMEIIRNHLQLVLEMDGAHAQDLKLSFEDGESAVSPNDRPSSCNSSDTATLLSAKATDFLPFAPNSDAEKDNVDALIDSATSSIFNILKGTKTQQLATSTKPPVDSTITAEICILRDSLEKERYRRNHCEKQIHKLQNRILEIQQELAVGQSVSRKKDMMIEQLDKTLAKVVTGWKSHEQTLVDSVQTLTQEKSKLLSELKKRNEVTADLKSKLMKALEELSAIRERLLLKEEEMTLLQQTFQLKTHEISRVLDQKNSSIEKLLNDKQTMVAEINKLTKNIEEMQENVEEEKKRASQGLLKEKRLSEEQLRKAKLKSEQEQNRIADLCKMLSSTQEEVTRLEELMGSLKQTIENLKLQSSVDEAKYAAAVRKMAAEHEIEIEKRVTEKLAKFHKEAEDKEKGLRDAHHMQVVEINKSHENEMANQCRIYEERIDTLERRAREDLQIKDRKFVELLKEKTEGMRQQMMSKMQNLLQAHYNETLQVVGNTSGSTPFRVNGAEVPAYQQGLGTSNLLSGSKLQDITNLNISTMTLGETFRETRTMPMNLEISNACGGTDHLETILPREAVVSSSSVTHLASSSTSSLHFASLPKYTSDTSQEKKSLIDYSTSLASSTAVDAKRFADNFHSPTELKQNSYENEIVLPASTMVTPCRDEENEMNTSEDRKQCLQHYIKMLLDRSPGEPLDIPQPSLVPVQPIPPSSLSDHSPAFELSRGSLGADKENNNMDSTLPKHATSEVALGVIDFLNQQLRTQPSPDLIPDEKHLNVSPQLAQSMLTSKQPSRNGTSSAFSHVKLAHEKTQTKKGQQSGIKRSPKKQDTRLSVKDLDGVQSTRMEQQVGNVSRMLSAYMSGDTQQAAEKLISYLADSQKKGAQDLSFKDAPVSKSSGKNKTPSKSSLPAWR